MSVTTTHPEFVKWPSIQRLSSEICYITEKIDGTNGVIYVGEDGVVLAGSRERWLSNPDGTPCVKQADNFGFSQWVYDRKDALIRLGHGFHYGEFHGAGIQRSYGLKNKRWMSFAYYRDDLTVIHEDVCVTPLLYAGEVINNNPAHMLMPWDACIEALRENGSVLYSGFMKPEGVVITFKEMRAAKFKRLCENDKIHKKQQEKL